MTKPRPLATALARAVVAVEMARHGSDGAGEAIVVALRTALGKLIGSNGFDVLLSRALRLAQKGDPALAGITLAPDGELKGLRGGRADVERGLTAVLSQFIELLLRFIGEDLAARVITDVWPDAKKNVESSKETKR